MIQTIYTVMPGYVNFDTRAGATMYACQMIFEACGGRFAPNDPEHVSVNNIDRNGDTLTGEYDESDIAKTHYYVHSSPNIDMTITPTKLYTQKNDIDRWDVMTIEQLLEEFKMYLVMEAPSVDMVNLLSYMTDRVYESDEPKT